MNHYRLIAICLFVLCCKGLKAQDVSTFKLVFYNVENYFDTYDDSLTLDDEFTSEGSYAWNSFRYKTKQRNIFKVISNIGEWDPPALICLSEVENEYVLKDLIENTPLKDFNYRVVHKNSPDERGIDVALLYRESVFQVLQTRNLNITFPFDSLERTRDILYVKGKLSGPTIHLYINHWPSRRGGVTASEKYRMYAARTLLDHVQGVLSCNSEAKIVILGDFNDEGKDNSLQLLSAFNHAGQSLSMLKKEYPKKTNGTLKYKGNWYTFDHILVSSALLDDSGILQLEDSAAYVFAGDFMLIDDNRKIGYKPYRTYQGPKYTGGYSDHLPVFLKLKLTTN